MRTDLRPAVTRRSVLLAFLSPLRPTSQPRQPQACMTPVADAWTRFFLWTCFTPATGQPAAA